MSASTDIITLEEKAAIKENIKKRLKTAGFIFGETDATTFMVKIETVEVEESNAIYIQIGLGEEVKTARQGNIYTFAFTYLANDFIDSDEPYQDTMESVNFLISQFIESYKDDNE